ncbi:hypothetical protein NRB20_75470 [Nocardia sp. RB20]|uniref:Uncharacterized protein n=1 Tax=Nocardia macrotermitis TaxID=2585198 RepID=A0A7K0DGJ2_9NOCA|nr:hypothetical protein [Nocardia macrotermitis]
MMEPSLPCVRLSTAFMCASVIPRFAVVIHLSFTSFCMRDVRWFRPRPPRVLAPIFSVNRASACRTASALVPAASAIALSVTDSPCAYSLTACSAALRMANPRILTVGWTGVWLVVGSGVLVVSASGVPKSNSVKCLAVSAAITPASNSSNALAQAPGADTSHSEFRGGSARRSCRADGLVEFAAAPMRVRPGSSRTGRSWGRGRMGRTGLPSGV